MPLRTARPRPPAPTAAGNSRQGSGDKASRIPSAIVAMAGVPTDGISRGVVSGGRDACLPPQLLSAPVPPRDDVRRASAGAGKRAPVVVVPSSDDRLARLLSTSISPGN